MASTKKVARGKTTKKKTATKAASKVTKKKTRKTTKKTAKKTTKKAVKKTVKRTVKKAKNKASDDQVAAVPVRTREQITSFDEKLQAVEILHKKKEETVKSDRVVSTMRVRKPVVRNRLSLMIPSLPAVPANIDALAVQTARLSGVAFVVLGGIFALNFAQYIWSDQGLFAQHATGMFAQVMQQQGGYSQQAEEGTGGGTYSQQAQLANPLPSPYPECQDIFDQNILDDCEDAAQQAIDDALDQTALDSGDVENPSINISVAGGAGSILSDTVDVAVTVAGVQKVEVYASVSWNTDDILLGHAQQTSDPAKWRYRWDTTTVADGVYTLKAKVYNYYNPTGYLDSGLSYEVNNTEDTASETVDVQPPATVTLVTPSPVDDVADFDIAVADAEEVRLYFRHADGGSLSNIPYRATAAGVGMWKHTWDTSAVPDGRYRVHAEVKNHTSGDKYSSTPIVVEIEHPADTADDSTEDAADTADDGMTEEELVVPAAPLEAPSVEILDPGPNPLSGYVSLAVKSPNANSVELYSKRAGAATKSYIGNMQRVPGSDRWKLSWNTNNTPNGDYTLYAKVTNSYGSYEGDTREVSVSNEMLYVKTEEQKQDLEVIEEAVKVTEAIVNEKETTKQVATTSLETAATTTSSETTTDRAAELISDFNEDIDQELQRFAAAYRSGDQERIDAAYERLNTLKSNIIARLRSSEDSEELLDEIDKRIDATVERYRVEIDEVDTLIEKRVSQEVFKDSDGDGITDYDEVALFNTDPFVADTDGDGFNDGVEIERGFDPLDARREVAVVHESPKETGVVRSDILRVDRVEPVVKQVADALPGASTEKVHADISGYALPNSYVTIYIFSTPVVVTVKTDEDGAWRYTFDEELEDGEHNVYVGVTDNAGKIVAKSEPFTFVKEAQAFSPVDTAIAGAGEVQTASGNESLLSQYMIYLIISVSVISIGLVLILLGIHLDSRGRRREGAVATAGADEAATGAPAEPPMTNPEP